MNYIDFFNNGITDLIPLRRGEKVPVGRWKETVATAESVASWQDGNLGLRTAYYPCIDIDVLDKDLADDLHDLALRWFQWNAPTRVGLPPKRTLLFKATAPFPKRWMRFERGNESYLIEILAGGQYTVVAGTHPSGRPFTWLDGVPHADDLIELTAESADAYLEKAAELVESQGWSVVGRKSANSGATHTDQNALKWPGDPQVLDDLVAQLPNDVVDREMYLTYGFAMRAAFADHLDLGRQCWLDWCARWTEGHNDPATCERDWETMAGPYRVGYSFLLDRAREVGINTAALDFEPLDDEAVVEPADDTTVPDTALTKYTHAWLARRFLMRHSHELKVNVDRKAWMLWNGQRWEQDFSNRGGYLLGLLGQEASREALAGAGKDKVALSKWCLTNGTIVDSLKYAARDPALATPDAAFDADPWLFNTPGGVVDLKTGAIRPHDASLLMTCMAGAAPARIPTPRWDAFLEEATGGDIMLQGYLRRLTGYCLTGSTREQMLAFFWGPGGNGKGVFLQTVTRALGDYAKVSAMDTFTAAASDRHPADLAALTTARLVTAQETQAGRSWDEAKLKSITGGDKVSARFMRENFFEFEPKFKLLFAGNHRPHIPNLDPAMKRRLHLIPFTVTPARVDHELPEALIAELPGIVQWMVDGCLEWQEVGLQPPAVVLDASAEYFTDEDPKGRWLAECTEASTVVTSTKELFDSWCRWCAEQGEAPGSMRALSVALRDRGLANVRSAGARGFRLAIKNKTGGPAPIFGGEPVELSDFDLIPIRH